MHLDQTDQTCVDPVALKPCVVLKQTMKKCKQYERNLLINNSVDSQQLS